MVASLLVMLLFMVFVLPAQSKEAYRQTGSDRSPDTSFYYSPQELYQMAADYGEEGRQAYITARWTFDLVFPLVYTSFLTIGISWFITRLPGWSENWSLANLLPILGGIFDLLENTAATLVMSAFPSNYGVILTAASLFTPIKWILVSAGFVPYFVYGATWGIQQIRKRKE